MIGGVNVDNHTYLYATIKHADGTITYDYRNCRVDIMVYEYEVKCECGSALENEYITKYYHNSCGIGIVS